MVNGKEKLRYIFPSAMAKRMKTIDTRTQLESSMLSLFLIMIGMTLFAIYTAIYGEQGWVFKSLMIFNLLCGWFLIGSSLVTTYQQYVSYMSTMDIDPDKEREEIKKKGNFFKRLHKFLKDAKERGDAMRSMQKRMEETPTQEEINKLITQNNTSDKTDKNEKEEIKDGKDN